MTEAHTHKKNKAVPAMWIFLHKTYFSQFLQEILMHFVFSLEIDKEYLKHLFYVYNLISFPY